MSFSPNPETVAAIPDRPRRSPVKIGAIRQKTTLQDCLKSERRVVLHWFGKKDNKKSASGRLIPITVGIGDHRAG